MSHFTHLFHFYSLSLSRPLSECVCVSLLSSITRIILILILTRAHTKAGRAVKQMRPTFCTSEAQQCRYPAWRGAGRSSTEGDDGMLQGRGLQGAAGASAARSHGWTSLFHTAAVSVCVPCCFCCGEWGHQGRKVILGPRWSSSGGLLSKKKMGFSFLLKLS